MVWLTFFLLFVSSPVSITLRSWSHIFKPVPFKHTVFQFRCNPWGKSSLYSLFRLEEHYYQQCIQKFVSISSNAFLGHFQLQQGTMVLCCQDAITMIVISKAYWIEFFETSTCFNIWSRFRQRWIFLIAYTRQWSPIPRSDTPPWDNFWESFVRHKSVVLRVSILVMRVWWRRWN